MVIRIQRTFLIALLVAMTCACASLKQSKEGVQGVYKQEDNPSVELRFEGSSFLFIDTYEQTHLPPYDCCDTITYGYFELEQKRGLLKLYSDPKLSLPISMSVKEEVVDGSHVTFVLDSPLEEFYKETERKSEDVFYRLSIDSNTRSLEYLSSRDFDTNNITFEKPSGAILRKFYISIYPKHSFSGRNLGTREAITAEYVVKDPNANLFKVSLPDLSNSYLTFTRHFEDYVKVTSQNKLEWDGETYLKVK